LLIDLNQKLKYDDPENKGYSLQNFAVFLNSALNTGNSFLVITGDVIPDNSDKSNAFLNQYFTQLPILYTPGNADLNPSKFYPTKDSYFFTDTEFYLFLNTNEESKISQQQQLWLYNALLNIEKLPNIKNIFVISHNLNWQR
jgi:hypothetical protein